MSGLQCHSFVRDDIVQFDCIGFCRVDNAHHEGQAAVYLNVSTGKGA